MSKTNTISWVLEFKGKRIGNSLAIDTDMSREYFEAILPKLAESIANNIKDTYKTAR